MNNSIISTNFVRFESEGLELVVDTSTGKAYASKSAAARMLEIDEKTVRNQVNLSDSYSVYNAQIPTSAGMRYSDLLSADTIFDLALKYHPQLARKMGAAGANVYVLGLAGYKTQVANLDQIDLPTDELGWMELAVTKKKEALALAAYVETNSERTALGAAIEISGGYIRVGEMAKQLGIGQKKYFQELRECKIIMADGRLPYQQYMKYFKVTQACRNGKYIQVALISPRGQTYLAKRHQDYLEQKLIDSTPLSLSHLS